jgi:hypothetical protein
MLSVHPHYSHLTARARSAGKLPLQNPTKTNKQLTEQEKTNKKSLTRKPKRLTTNHTML